VPLVPALACVVSSEPPRDEPPVADVPAEDLVEISDIKGDGASFDAAELMDDAAFVDTAFMSRAEVQAFLEATPYDSRSFLADYAPSGKSTAELIVEASAAYRISPIVLLVKLQVERGLVSKTVRPAASTLDHAMGCGCPDYGSCSTALSGFESQIECAAEVFRSYLDDLAAGGATVAGWKVATAKKSLDGLWVSPKTRATAALYTYTPWVLRGTGGNWLFWNVYKKYARAVLEGRPNYHFIGGSCASASECPLATGQCLGAIPDGLCTQPCSGICPDSGEPFTAVTFCADLGSVLGSGPAGYCLSRCDTALYETNGGCRPGFHCGAATRFGDPSTSKWVCWPP
jgi:hypothetical protein